MDRIPDTNKIVIKPYTAAYPDPIAIQAGEKLILFERESEWPEWVWCQAQNGKEGWVPAAYICKQGAEFTAAYDYDAKELSVNANETVEILREESGWVWSRNDAGAEGWVPLDYIGR